MRFALCVALVGCWRGDPTTPSAAPALVACYEGRGIGPRPGYQSEQEEVTTVIRRTLDPPAHQIVEDITEFDRYQNELSFVERVDGNSFTIEDVTHLLSGKGTMEAGEPWKWTAWSWVATNDNGDLNITSHYRMTPTGLSIRRTTVGSARAHSELKAFDCLEYDRRIQAIRTQLYGK